jgi:uncharacterized repeat protein (TIGR01451 family)
MGRARLVVPTLVLASLMALVVATPSSGSGPSSKSLLEEVGTYAFGSVHQQGATINTSPRRRRPAPGRRRVPLQLPGIEVQRASTELKEEPVRSDRVRSATAFVAVAMLVVALSIAASGPASAAAPPAATFNPSLLLPNSTSAGEPSIRTDRFGNAFVIGPIGVPAGCKAFKVAHNGSSATYLGFPDHTAGGGDCDWALGPQETASLPGFGSPSDNDLAYSSLSAGDITVGKSNDGGQTFGPPNPAGAQVAGDDRMWQGADPKLNSLGFADIYMTYHDLSITDIELSVSRDGGQTYSQNGPIINPTDVPQGQWQANNELGNIVARRNPTTGALTLYSIFQTPDSAADNASQTANQTANFNRVYEAVGTVTDLPAPGAPVIAWRNYEVYHGAVGTQYDRIFPVTAVDSGGTVYAVWTDGKSVLMKAASGGTSWGCPANSTLPTGSAPCTAPVTIPNPFGLSTTTMPWVAAGSSGRADVVYYGATGGTAGNNDDPNNQWNVYMAQTIDGGTSWGVFKASDHVIHKGRDLHQRVGLRPERGRPNAARLLPGLGRPDQRRGRHRLHGRPCVARDRGALLHPAVHGRQRHDDGEPGERLHGAAAAASDPAGDHVPWPTGGRLHRRRPEQLPGWRRVEHGQPRHRQRLVRDTGREHDRGQDDDQGPRRAAPSGEHGLGLLDRLLELPGNHVLAQATSNGSRATATYSFSDGTYDTNFNPVGTPTGTVTPGPNGTIVMDVPRADVGSPPDGATLSNPSADTHGSFTVGGTGVYYTAPADRAPDSGYGAPYTVGQTCKADLSVSKSGPSTGHVGQAITYTITVHNAGTDAAQGVSVTDTLPKNAGFGTVSSTQGTCAPKPKQLQVVCTIGTMANGATVTITLVVKPTTKGNFTDTASVTETSPGDPDASSNTSSVTTKVSP